MRRWLDVKLLLLLIGSTAFLIIFSNIGVAAYQSVFSDAKGYASGTQVGSINIADLDSQEAMTAVLDGIDHWKMNSSFLLQIQEKEIQLEPSFINFDVKTSVDSAVSGQTTPLIATIDQENIESQLKPDYEELIEILDFEKVVEDIKKTVLQLNVGTYTYNLSDYLSVSEQQFELLAKTTITGFESSLEPYLQDWIEEVETISVEPMDIYSVLSVVEEQRMSEQRLEALNIIASNLYEAVLIAGLDVNERYISQSLKPYFKPGYEAKVNPGTMDLVFKNTTPFPVEITFNLVNSTLVTEINGYSTDYDYEVDVQNYETFAPKKIIQYTPVLTGRQTRVLSEGKNGLQVEVHRIKYDKANAVVDSQVISKDFYPPIHAVVQMPMSGGDFGWDSDRIPNNNNDEDQPESEPNDNSNGNEQLPPPITDIELPDPDEVEIIWGTPDDIEKGD